MQRFETVIVGAGPAGLTAALYLARYRRKVLVLHDGKSRALRIPRTYNAPGFPDGVVGAELIERMTAHAERYGASILDREVVQARRSGDGFELVCGDGDKFRARALVLATGIDLVQVDLDHEVHEQAIADGVLRYCPVCDGFEHSDARIGVIGCDSNGAAEALFLRRYSADITLMPLSWPELSADEASQLAEAGIKVESGALERLEPHDDRMEVRLAGRATALAFDVIYPALGCRPRSRLAEQLGLPLDEDGCVPTGGVTGELSSGLFVAGDLVQGLDQISVAMGHGALAATRAHNWLREQDHQVLDRDA